MRFIRPGVLPVADNCSNNRLWEWFDKVDKDQSGDIDATELRKYYFSSGSRFDAYFSPRECSDKRRLVPCVLLDVYLSGWHRSFEDIASIDFDLNTINLLMNIVVCLIAWPLFDI
jgi:hypothetical protein